MRKSHRAAFERFVASWDQPTTYNYTRFGYRVNQRHVAPIVFADMAKRKMRGHVLLDDERIIGFGHLDLFAKEEKRHIAKLGIVLDPTYVGRGLGGKLLDFMIADAKKMGFEKVWLSTYSDNPRATRLYRSRGFVVEGVFRREEKVGNRYRDVISMALFIRPGRRVS